MRAGRVAVILGAGGALALAASALPSCGGSDPFCGDGVMDDGEECDDGNTDETDNCRLCVAHRPARTRVKWTFNSMAGPGFTSDGCIDVQADQVEVALTGPFSETRRLSCSTFMTEWVDLPPGEYTATVTPLDDGQSLVNAPAPSATFPGNTTLDSTVEHTINVPPAAWSRPMTGTYLFVLRWQGADCAGAAPPVTTQVVQLMLPGGPATQIANTMTSFPDYRMDGSQPAPCVLSTLGMSEAAQQVPFGPATLTVSGRDGVGVEWFRGTFETFVGAGTSNTVMQIDVPSVIDAGVDAPIDAPIDGPDIDAPDVDAPDIDAAIDAAPDA